MPRIHPKPGSRRNAAILFVTIVLLTLFLVIGLCFVLFAESQATSARIYREANNNIADVYDPASVLMAYGLSQTIYDADDVNGVFSAMRGYSLARDMYGWNYTLSSTLSPISTGTNNVPFNGAGRLHTGAGTYMNPYNTDDQQLINYQWFSNDGFRRDPEFFQPYTAPSNSPPTPNGQYTGGVNSPYTAPDMNHVFLAAVDANGNVTVPSFWRGNQVGMTLNTNTADPAWTDPNQPIYKYKSLRPRPADQLTLTEIAGGNNNQAYVQSLLAANQIFPMPASNTGDVRNMPGPGPNDSIWMDLGYPVRRLAGSGIKVKPLYAFLIVDMDGRVNYNIAGDVREASNVNYGYHGSIQGWGPWEVNPRQLMALTANPFGNPPSFPAGGSTSEYLNLFRGVGGNYGGRYGNMPLNSSNQPNTPDLPPYPPAQPQFPVPGSISFSVQSFTTMGPKYYNWADFNGSSMMVGSTNGPAKQVAMPAPLPTSFDAFPNFPSHYENGLPDERYAHPLLYNPFNLNLPPGALGAQGDHYLPINDLQGLIGWLTPQTPAGPTGPPFATSPDTTNTWIGQLWPTNITNYPRLRNMITPHSIDLDLPGAAPGQPTSPLGFNTGANPGINRVPQGNGTTFQSQLANRGGPAPNGDFNQSDWKSILPALGKVDLNRTLTPYPTPTKGMALLNPLTNQQYVAAVRDRVYLARDIFSRLQAATGASPITNAFTAGPDPTGNAQFEALRYLAQLAVNIVDYIDDDDISTAFNFLGDQLASPPQVPDWGWVFGVEMPRLVINEAYGQLENDPQDKFSNMKPLTYQPGAQSDPNATPISQAFPATMPMDAKATANYHANFFVELHNPHRPDGNAFDQAMGTTYLQFSNSAQPIYQLVIQSQVDSNLTRATSNVTGLPQPTNISNTGAPQNPAPLGSNATIYIQTQSFTTDNSAAGRSNPNYFVSPANGAYSDPTYTNQGYFVVGPSTATGFQDTNNQPQFPNNHGGGGGTWDYWPTTAVSGSIAVGGSGTASTTLSVSIDKSNDPSVFCGQPQNQPGVFLMRLANPYIPFQGNRNQPAYNPYITVDYIEQVPINNAVLYDSNGPRDGKGPDPAPAPSVNSRFSVGRRQPFKAARELGQTSLTPQSPNPALANTAQQTFFSQNGQSQAAPGSTLDPTFNWLTFGDRLLTSPADLLHVTAYKPHELTQEFMNPNYAALGAAKQLAAHEAPWRNSQTRLYRALELMGVHSQMNNVAFGARVPGKVNINTQVGAEVWNAVCDADVNPAQPRHYFNQQMVNYIYNNVIPNPNGWTQPTQPAPVWGTAMPWAGNGQVDSQYPPPAGWASGSRTGVDDTLYANNPASSGTGFLQVSSQAVGSPAPTNDSYTQEELLKKIMNSVTTRSNVFAVYITTGWFVVRDDSVTGSAPVKLGQEISTSLRHKMFAVVDRTNLSIATTVTNGQVQQLPTQGNRPIYFPLVLGNNATVIDTNPPQPSVNTTVSTAYLTSQPGPGAYLYVRDTIDHFGNDYTPLTISSGVAVGSGANFQITVGTPLYLDVGANQELVKVISINPKPGSPGQSTMQIQRWDGSPFKFRHYSGCSICTAMIGNPGPQSQFLPFGDPTQPYWNTVLPYSTILQ